MAWWEAWWAPLLIAPFLGSFLGLLALRLPAGEGVVWGRSRCVGCARPLGPLELVPLASFLALRGLCRCKRVTIPRVLPAMELGALAVAAAAAAAGGGAGMVWANCALGWALLVLAAVDWAHLELPDALTLPLVPAGLAVTWWLAPESLLLHVLGALVGWGAFAGLALLYRRWRGRDGLGAGDAKLLAAGGAWLGLAALPELVLLAALLGLGLALGWRLAGRALEAGTALPFGPPLALAIFALRLHGPMLHGPML